ncbi:eukaryotic translation initiation factor 5B [Hetaerina americana]|uniref:eukaryotic translation initiation factor 5B n=1 Tax=Hetaerina americana TaxID=62018 RepID=UPI003A7F4338
MTKACLWLACSLVLLIWPPRVTGEALLSEQEAPEGAGGDEDSLRPAIEVLSRRQRDLAGRQQPYGNYGPGLLRYHYEPTRRNGDSNNLEFLSTAEDEGVGQPEDIGYGYQRGYGGGGGLPGGRDDGVREQQAAAGARMLENLLRRFWELREYLDRGKGEGEEGEEAERAEDSEKRSAFRERGGETASKRASGRFVGPPLTGSSFRERLIQELEGGGEEEGEGAEEGPDDEEEGRRKRLLAVIKRLEDEDEEGGGEEEGEAPEEGGNGLEEEERRRKRVRDEEDDSGPAGSSKLAALMDLFENLMEKYEAEKAAEGAGDYGDDKGGEEKRARGRGRKYSDGGPTFDHFNSPMGWMGGGGGGGGFDGFGRRRRTGGGGRLRTYSPPLSRDPPRVWFSEAEAQEVPPEAHRKHEFLRRADERWDGEGMEEDDVGLSPEDWGAALESGTGGSLILPSRQRRFPVAKRSSKRVLLPGAEGERRKRRESGKEAKTDPKVAQVLSQIFESGDGGSKGNETKDAAAANKEEESKMKKKSGGPEKKEEKEDKRKRKKAGEDLAKVTPVAAEGSDAKEDKKKAILKVKKRREGEGEVAAAVGEPETVKREKTEVKKSVDWSQYFGIDRRRKKSGAEHSEKEKGEEDEKRKREGEGGKEKEKEREGEEEKLDDWLLNQYYKTLAMSTNIVKRGGPARSRMPHAGVAPAVVEAEETDEGGLDAMDGKLRRVEDAIVEEAIKDTGAHMGGPDGSAEGVRERVLSRLAAVYSLEKMRKALTEFKANLREEEEDDEQEGEAPALGKGRPMPKEPSDVLEMERDRRRGREGAEGAFMGPPLAAAEPMSEGYMGGRAPMESNEVSGGECPALERLATNCQGIGDLAGDYQHLFLDLCNWHEVCYICGSSASSNGISSCDITFLREVDSLCHGHEGCRQSGRRMAVALRALRGKGGKHLHQHQSKSASVCWQHPCLADYLARRRRR